MSAMAQKIDLQYNTEQISCSVVQKRFLGFLTPGMPDPIDNLTRGVTKALDNPVRGPTLDKFLSKGDQIVIVVSDITRYTAAELFLPLVIERINQAGIPDRNISIVFALGIHRLMTGEEQRTVVGEEIAQRIALYNHNAEDTAQLVSLGTTSRGTPIAINKRAAEADKLMVTGTIGFHYLAGFGGGRKSIIPGIASYETCVANHLLTLDPRGNGRHPSARTGILYSNPMHEDMVEACGQLPPTFLCNTILSPHKKMLDLVAGDLNESFYQGCDVVKRHFAAVISQLADLVIVSCGGYPKDINFIQAHKAIDYAMNALRPGGVMIVVAACRDGIGNPDFLKWIKYPYPEEMLPALRKDFQINGQTAHATLMKAQQARILLLSELSDTVVQEMSIMPVHSMEEALKKGYEIVGANPSMYVIPYGSVTLPLLEER